MKRDLLKYFFLILSINCFSQNQFRNGTSPTTTRYLFPDQNANGLNHLMYNTEGLDGLNFFGSRLLDIDFDGKIDVVMRAKEYLEGDWDFPSGNPRMYLKGNITNDFNFKFEKKDLLIADGTKVVFDSVSSKKFVFNHTFQDATGVNQIGVKNFDVFYTSKGLVKYEDYNFDDDFFWVTNRIYEVSNGEVKDITRINLVYSDRIKNDVVRFFNAQASVSADIDSDGDLDIILSGRTVAFKYVPPGFTNNYGNNIHNILVFKNLGNGKLFADIMDVSNIGAFVINEGNQLYALNMDDDKELEVLTSISVGSGVVLSPNREFGYIDFNLNDNSVSL